MATITIAHTTTYRYRTAVVLGPHRLMLRPRETRDLILTAFDLEITPTGGVAFGLDSVI